MRHLLTQSLIISGLLIANLVSSCVSTPKRSYQVYPNQKKSAAKSKIIKKQGTQVDQDSTESKPSSNMNNIATLETQIRKFLDPDYEFTESDFNLMAAMELPPEPNSVTEAMVTLASLHIVIHNIMVGEESPPVESNAVDERNLQAKTGKIAKTVQEQFAQTGINPFEAFNLNPYLQSIWAFRLLGRTLQMSADGVQLRETFTDMILAKNQNLTDIANVFKNNMAPVQSDDSVEAITRTVDPSQYRAADLLLGDNILLQAQKLAEKGRFKSAIMRASKVQDQDPYFPTAKEKIKQFSNLAVQDLRQKAAQAFQRSLPVVDVKTKTAYLEAAKKYLEEALAEFPAADHLTTVRENLAVITRDLATIQQDTSIQLQ